MSEKQAFLDSAEAASAQADEYDVKAGAQTTVRRQVYGQLAQNLRGAAILYRRAAALLPAEKPKS